MVELHVKFQSEPNRFCTPRFIDESVVSLVFPGTKPEKSMVYWSHKVCSQTRDDVKTGSHCTLSLLDIRSPHEHICVAVARIVFQTVRVCLILHDGVWW